MWRSYAWPARCVAFAGLLACLSFASPAGAQEMQYSQGELIRSLLPSVVNVTIRKEVTGQGDDPVNASASAPGGTHTMTLYGSGFVVDASGVIVTNYHVVQDAWDISVGFSDGSRAPAHLMNATRLVDIALLKVEVDHKLPPVKWGDSDKLQVGDPVLAIGNPFGIGTSVTAGIVSALNRDIMDSPYDDFIQTDAAINHGNSGGPLFDMKGEAIGVDTALISPTTSSAGLGFAIPARSARRIIERLMNYGWLRPGWIGVKIQQVTLDMMRALRMPKAEGSIVANITPGGPSEQAGLRIGDVILRIGDAAPSDERALLRAIATTQIGQSITLGLWRDGKEQSLSVTVAEWPRSKWDVLDAPVQAAAPHRVIPADLGITLAALTDESRARFGVRLAQTGILVTGVAAGTDAAERGLVPGDVILRVNEKTVTAAGEIQQGFDTARADRRDFVLLLIQPKAQIKPGPEWLALRVAEDESAPAPK